MSDQVHPQKLHFSGVFHRASQTYDGVGVDFFGPLAAALIDRAGLGAGDSALDLGCGRGAALFEAARLVGPDGHVVGVDLADGMVERTAADVVRRGLGQVQVRHGDADHPPARAGGWDAVSASFVLFFLPDPTATAARVRAVLRPRGVFVVSTFDQPDPRWSVIEAAIRPFWSEDTSPSHPASRGSFATVESTEALLLDAGFGEVDTVVIDHANVYSDADHWLAWTWSAGARVIWERVRDGELEAAQQAALAVVGSLAEPDGTLVERFRVRLTRAVAP